MEKGRLLFLLVGPSGVGKTTLIRQILTRTANLVQMPTATTRAPRAEEVDVSRHLFLSEEQFDQLVQQGAFLEWQAIFGERYGALRSVIEQCINSGEDHTAEIEVIGASMIKESYPDNVILISIVPPSISVLERRLTQRGSMSAEEITSRLDRAAFELSCSEGCDYVIRNDDLETAADILRAIILAERSRRDLVDLRVI